MSKSLVKVKGHFSEGSRSSGTVISYSVAGSVILFLMASLCLYYAASDVLWMTTRYTRSCVRRDRAEWIIAAVS